MSPRADKFCPTNVIKMSSSLPSFETSPTNPGCGRQLDTSLSAARPGDPQQPRPHNCVDTDKNQGFGRKQEYLSLMGMKGQSDPSARCCLCCPESPVSPQLQVAEEGLAQEAMPRLNGSLRCHGHRQAAEAAANWERHVFR